MEQIAREAIRALRLQKLRGGQPFMINANDHEPGTCWLEYPDGHIHLVRLNAFRTDFETITKMSIEESDMIRKDLGLK
ncbi:MAG: hypothetical protein U0U70_08325 [Chitinophagaceae bacterium]